jgi:hypothetical protein
LRFSSFDENCLYRWYYYIYYSTELSSVNILEPFVLQAKLTPFRGHVMMGSVKERRIHNYLRFLAILIFYLVLASCGGSGGGGEGGEDGGGSACGVVTAVGPQTATPAVSAGNFHTVALRRDGTVWTWGENKDGQLGIGSTSDCSTPAQVTGLTDVNRIAAGYRHTLALKSDGTVWAWGDNSDGQLGDGTTTDQTSPVPVKDPNDPTGFLTGVTAIAAGESHTLALKSNGTVWAWGFNAYGQLGNGSLSSTPTLQPVQVLDLNDAVAIAAGKIHSVVLRGNGSVLAWGFNADGRLGNGSLTGGPEFGETTPVPVMSLTAVVALVAGDGHNLALQNGEVWSWGKNNKGQLGNGTTDTRIVPGPVSNLTDVSAVAAGFNHSLAVKIGGTAWAWGDNFLGQLGVGITTGDPQTTPVQVASLIGIIAIAGGGNHSVALKGDGTVWAWGDNQSGQLGIGTASQTSSPSPVQVIDLTL